MTNLATFFNEQLVAITFYSSVPRLSS